jgi:GT2 family glycosyltransferase
MTDLSVIIVSYNSQEFLRACLRSIYRNAPRCSWEVIVVDNASGDKSAQMVAAECPQTTLLINDANVGFSRAVNQGLAIGKGRYILLLNPDTLILPGTFDALVGFMDGHPQVGAAGPRQWVDIERTLQAAVTLKPPTLRMALAAVPLLGHLFSTEERLQQYWAMDWEIWRSRTPFAVESLTAACLIVRHKVVDQVGPLDEGFFMFYEDADWCRRIRDAGWKVCFVPQAEIIHFGMKSSPGAEQARRMLVDSTSYYIRKHRGFPAWLLWRLLRLAHDVASGPRRWRKWTSSRGESPTQSAGSRIRIEWSPVEGADSFLLEFAMSPAFLYKIGAQVRGTHFTLPTLFQQTWPQGRYFWRVAPLGSQGTLGRFADPQPIEV